jgi:NCAIR mutase (PurE)-related protein
MDKRELLDKLNQVKSGALSPAEMLAQLKRAPFDDIGYAVIDNHRGVRQGFGEVIYGAGKTGEQIAGIAKTLYDGGSRNILITRMAREKADLVAGQTDLWYHEMSGIGVVGKEEKPLLGHVVVASGGTSDMAVCEEAALTLETFGNRVTRLYDVGVAGLHRILSRLDVLFSARCVIAVAGMEGALASVVGGLVDCPVIAVPTSVGYGANFGGVSALLSMLNSCASGVSVVNIDNGFGAGYLAAMINQMEGLK